MRDKTPRDVIAQALDYAGESLTCNEISAINVSYLKVNLQDFPQFQENSLVKRIRNKL